MDHKYFEAAFDAGICYSVNMFKAETEEDAKRAAEAHAIRYGYSVAYVKEIPEADAESNLRKGMPITYVPHVEPETESDREPITVKSVDEAWKIANRIFPTDYVKDDLRSDRAGYPVYHSTASGVSAWISDLSDRLEINLPDGRSINVWIAPDPEIPEDEMEDLLRAVDEFLYQIDDRVNPETLSRLEIPGMRDTVYAAFRAVRDHLEKTNRKNSPLWKRYNLREA